MVGTHSRTHSRAIRRGTSRKLELSPYPLAARACTADMAFVRVYETCHAGSRGSASLPWSQTLFLMLTRMGAACLHASFCGFCERALALSDLRFFPISFSCSYICTFFGRAAPDRAGARPYQSQEPASLTNLYPTSRLDSGPRRVTIGSRLPSHRNSKWADGRTLVTSFGRKQAMH